MFQQIKNMNIMNNNSQNNINRVFSYSEIFWTFFRIGLFTFGGGLAMGTVIRYELVLKNGWINDDDFMSEFSTATIIPGSISVNIAYLQGNRLRGKMGAMIAVTATILPSFIIILAIVYFGLPYFTHPKVVAFFKGSALAVAAQLLFTGSIFSKKLLTKWCNVIICLISLFMAAVIGLHPIWSLVTAAILGYFLPNRKKESYKETENNGNTNEDNY